MTSSTAFKIFPPSLVHSLNVFLQDVGSGKSVSCIDWENTLPFNLHPKASPYIDLYILGRFKKSKYYQIFATSGLSVVPKVK